MKSERKKIKKGQNKTNEPKKKEARAYENLNTLALADLILFFKKNKRIKLKEVHFFCKHEN
jgi:hypothetical protein